MRIAFFTLGSRGDVEPIVALARGFAAAGHEAFFVTDESARPLVQPHGLRAHFLRGSVREHLSSSSGHGLWHARNPYSVAHALSGAYADVISAWAPEAAEAMQGSRLLIMSRTTFGIGYALAEKIRAIPCEAALAPDVSSRHLPSALLPWPSAPLPGAVKYLLNEAAIRAGWLGARAVVNAARRALGSEELSWPFGRARPAFLDSIPHLYGFSPTLVPRPPDWPKNITVTGFWHHGSDTSWQPSAALAGFLEAGPRPVYIGFGSVLDRRPARLQRTVLSALRRLGLRAVVATGWGAMTGVASTDEIFVVDDVPHDWLFPRVAAVVCHGGSGTIGAALRAGTPSVIVPYFADQPFWGWAMERLGVSPRSVPRRHLSVERLTAALRQATTDAAMRDRAAEIAALVRAEDGVRRAIEAIEAWLTPSLGGAPPLRPAAANSI